MSSLSVWMLLKVKTPNETTQTQTVSSRRKQKQVCSPTICYNLSFSLFLTLLHCKAAIWQNCKLTFAYRHSLAHLHAQAAELVGGAVFCLAGGKRSLGLRALKAQMSGSVGAWRCDHTALNAKRHIVWPKRLAECWYLQLFVKKKSNFFLVQYFHFPPHLTVSDLSNSSEKMCLGARIMQKSVIAFIYTWTLWHFYLCKQIFLAQLKHSALWQILLSWGGDATWVLLLLKQNGSN